MPIKIENLSHIYSEGTTFEHRALNDITLTIEDGEFIGLIGHTGSGKSTLIQHLNALVKPTSGRILIDDIDINAKETSKIQIRQKIGLVFQYPEHQLFEETVYKDIAFGPKNLGLDEKQIEKRVRWAMEMVQLNFEEIKEVSPFDLSGGQKRRVAIAGVMAMRPKVLILDEPTAGLDPRGRDQILAQIAKLHKEENTTIILVSHSMEDVAPLADKLLVMNKGQIVFFDEPKTVFKQIELLEAIGLGVPQVSKLQQKLNENGFEINQCLTIDDAISEILKTLRGAKKC